jgi:hypothetical protein
MGGWEAAGVTQLTPMHHPPEGEQRFWEFGAPVNTQASRLRHHSPVIGQYVLFAQFLHKPLACRGRHINRQTDSLLIFTVQYRIIAQNAPYISSTTLASSKNISNLGYIT